MVNGIWLLSPKVQSDLVPKELLNSEFIELLFYFLGYHWHLVSVAGEFKTCTILFSDVVTFTNICAACEPIQIVNMLNSMYSKFDRLTSVHEVYKVSMCTVGHVSQCVQVHSTQYRPFFPLLCWVWYGWEWDEEEELKGNWRYFRNFSFLGMLHNTWY